MEKARAGPEQETLTHLQSPVVFSAARCKAGLLQIALRSLGLIFCSKLVFGFQPHLLTSVNGDAPSG